MVAKVAFFDIGDTLGAVQVSGSAVSITPFPGVLDALRALRTSGARMGLLSNPGPIPVADVEAGLRGAGLEEFFDPALRVWGAKDSVRIFEQAAARVPAPRRLLFVGEDAAERGFAAAADFRVCPHPSLAWQMLFGPSVPLRYLRIRVPLGINWRKLLRGFPVVPLHVVAHAKSPVELYVVSDSATALALDDRGLWVDRLGDKGMPDATDLYLLRDAKVAPEHGLAEGAEGAEGAAALFAGEKAVRSVLASTPDGLLVAVPAGRSVEAFHIGHGLHGHNLKLTPILGLFEPEDAGVGVHGVADGPGLLGTSPDLAGAPALTPAEKAGIRQGVSTARIEREVGRYAGSRALVKGVTLRSRHIHHPDNARAVQGLLDDLAAMRGLTVRTHRFTHEGRAYDNVEAILPAAGAGAGSVVPKGIVLVTAHLDSTAARAPGYQAATDPAPGADDDASGVAAVLTAARTILSLAGSVGGARREIRFVLFNAEEHGLVGSRAYARDAAARRAGIVAVLQSDMIGFDSVAPRTFEVHAGFSPVPAVEKRSLALAELVARLARQVSPALPAAQVYPGSGGTGDPAEQRSDHYSFQLNGYAACAVTEDFFPGPGSTGDPNPNYHAPADAVVNPIYARDIARAVTAAAWVCATR